MPPCSNAQVELTILDSNKRKIRPKEIGVVRRRNELVKLRGAASCVNAGWPQPSAAPVSRKLGCACGCQPLHRKDGCEKLIIMQVEKFSLQATKENNKCNVGRSLECVGWPSGRGLRSRRAPRLVGGRRTSDGASGRDRGGGVHGTNNDEPTTRCSVVVSSATPVLSREVYLWMDDSL